MSDLLDRLNAALSDRYEVESEVGRGGMATVFLARDVKHDRRVALKVLHPDLAKSVGAERFLREINILARLNHPNILGLIDSGEADGLLYYVMPFVEGESLRQRLARESQLPIEDAVQVTREVADALGYAHGLDIVHRDIKPGNILFVAGHAVVSDFGIARAVTEAGGDQLTQTGLSVGTPHYMSPEQAAGEVDADPRSDLYSLGCVLYEMVGGEPPYTGPSSQAVLSRHSQADIPSVTIIRPQTPPHVQAVIEKSLSKSPADRFRSAERMRDALSGERVVSGVRRRATKSRGPRRVGMAVAAVTVLAVAVWGATRLWGPGSGDAMAEAGSIVIVPFLERGSGLDTTVLAGSKISRYLANHLLAGRHRPVRPAVVNRLVEELCDPGSRETVCANSVSFALETDLFVYGSVTLQRGDSVRIVAYPVNNSSELPLSSITVEGSFTDAISLLDSLTVGIWRKFTTENQRAARAAGLSTRSPAALSKFYEGEDHFDAWNLKSALTAYQQAVEIDSTFAMAWYRLAVIWDWYNRPPLKPALDMAIAHADRLPNRERRAVHAFNDLVWGASEKAEPVFIELLEEDPDDPFVNYQFGLLSFAYAWKTARPMTQAIESFRKVLAVQPENSSAMIYLIWALAEDGDYEEMEALDAEFPEISTFSNVIQMIRGHRLGDSSLVRAGLESWKVRPQDQVALGLYVLGTKHDAVPDLELVSNDNRLRTDSAYLAELFERPHSYVTLRVTSGDFYATGEFGRGRLRSSRAAYERMDSLPPSIAPPNMALLASLPLPGGNPSDTTGLAERVRSWTMPELLREWGGSGVTNTHKGNEHLIRPYVLGLLASSAGDYEAARSYADEVESLPVFWYPSVPHDLAQGVRADVLLRQGRPREAIEALDAAKWHLNYNEVFLAPIIGAGRAGYTRALALQQLGMHEEALRWYEYGLGPFFTMGALAATHFHRGEIHEELGDIDQAIWHYDAFAELWKDADPELMVKVREVLQHVAELRGEVVDVTAN